jgi:small subunit ribosomal protein S20
MANHKSAIKKAAHDIEARLRNRANRSSFKTAIKKFLLVVAGGNKTDAISLLPMTLGVVDKACRKGILHKNASNRYKSRLTIKTNTMV